MAEEIIEGLDELEKAIKKLEVESGGKALRNALMYASKPMLDDMKANAPIDESEERANNKRKQNRKHIAEVIKRRSKKADGKYAAQVGVGVFSKSLAYIAAFLHYGTKHSAPNTWMQQAADRNVDTAINRFKDKLRKNIEKATKK